MPEPPARSDPQPVKPPIASTTGIAKGAFFFMVLRIMVLLYMDNQ